MMPPSPNWIDRFIGRAAANATGGERDPSGLVPAIVVTGGSAGIGLAIAKEFHRQGHRVVIVARDAAKLEAAVAGFDDPGTGSGGGVQRRVQAVPLDVARVSAARELEAALLALGVYADVLVNNAGMGLAGPFTTHGEDELAALLAVNVAALTRTTRHFLPAMIARRRGGIINVASLGGYVPGPNQAAYYASKAYVCSLTESIAAEVAFTGVRVTVVAPGPVNTGFHAAMGADRSLYRWLLPALTAEQTARACVAGYSWGWTVVVPGFFNKVIAVCLSVLPHMVTVPFVKLLLARR